MLLAAGFMSYLLDDVHSEIWLKERGNPSSNPVSALMHEGMQGIARFPLTRGLSVQMMEEAQRTANKLGITAISLPSASRARRPSVRTYPPVGGRRARFCAATACAETGQRAPWG